MNTKDLKGNLEAAIRIISSCKNLETESELLTKALNNLIKSNWISNNTIEDDIEIVIDILTEKNSTEMEVVESILCDVLNTLRGIELNDIVEEVE
jgi:hypothetical protein